MQDCLRFGQGDHFLIQDERYSIFVLTSEIIGVIGLDKLAIQTFLPTAFFEQVKDGAIQILERPSPPPVSIQLSEEELNRIQKQAHQFDQLLADLYPNWERIGRKGQKNYRITQAALNLNLSHKQFMRLFIRYLRSGRNRDHLMDRRHLKGINKQEMQKTSALENKLPEQEVVTREEQAMQYGLAAFKEKLNVNAAYHVMLRTYYSSVTYEFKNGFMEEVVIPDDKRPSYSSFYRYVSSHLGERTVKQYIKGEKETRNNDRFLTGNQKSGLLTIGQAVQIDECEVAVDLVSEDGTKVIGKPILYCAFEPVSQIIIGAYIGFTNNSMSGVVNLFLSMLEPHENQTAPYGVHCDADTFPSMVIPKMIYTDQGAEYTSGHMAEAMRELGIVDAIVPVAAGSYKGGVENSFHRLQSRLKALLIHDGYILPTHEGPKAAREHACLTLADFKTILYRLILELNTTSLGNLYSPDLDLIENHIPPVPCEIWKYKRKNCYDPISVTDANRTQIMFALLWRDKTFGRGRDGLSYRNLRFFTDEDWFKELLVAKSPIYEVRYLDTDIRCIYVRYKKVIHKVPISTSRDELRSFLGVSWSVYDETYRQYQEMRKQQMEKDLQIQLTAEHQNEKTLQAARKLHDGVVSDKKQIRENRMLERRKLEQDPNEMKNRMLDVSTVPDQEIDELPDVEMQEDLFSVKSKEDILNMLEDSYE